MTGQEIIDEFDKLTDEMSELSATQKLALANAKYDDVNNDRDWQYLRKSASVTVTAGEIALPADFRNFAENNKTKYRFGFWIGTSFYPIVNMQDRRVHHSMSYYDKVNSKIVLDSGLSLNGQTAEFDYYHVPTALAVGTSPIFRASYHKIIPYLMATEHYPIDHTEGGRSQREVYLGLAEDVKEDLVYEDDQAQEDWLTS